MAIMNNKTIMTIAQQNGQKEKIRLKVQNPFFCLFNQNQTQGMWSVLMLPLWVARKQSKGQILHFNIFLSFVDCHMSF